MMKPTLKTEHIEVTYWDCGHGHRHNTEEIADRCIIKSASAIKRNSGAETRRALQIAAMRAVILGATWAEAGKILSTSQGRAREVIFKIMRMSTRADRFQGSFPWDDVYVGDIIRARSCPAFWLERADYMAKEWGV